MRIGLDCDGVLYKFTHAFQQHIQKCKPGIYTGLVDTEAPIWNWFTDWGMNRMEFLDEMDCAVDAKDLFWEGELYEDYIPGAIRYLQNQGHSIHVVTHRFSGLATSAEEATKAWFLKNYIFPDSLTFADDKTSIPTDIFLEDRHTNYDKLEAAGTKAYLINRPYNMFADNRRRVNTFNEFVLEVEGK